MEDQIKTKESIFPTLKLPLLPLTRSPEHASGAATPPLRALASVPFKWEEQPGKPRPCTDIITLPDPTKFPELQLPPCRLPSLDRIPKTPSPTTVLDGPREVGRPKFSSFRFFREAQGSFDSSCSSGITSPESADVDRVLLGKKSGGGQKVSKGYFGSFRFSSSYNTASCDGDERCDWRNNKAKNIRSFSSVSHAKSSTHIWAAIYEGLKQVIPWKSAKKSKKQVHV